MAVAKPVAIGLGVTGAVVVITVLVVVLVLFVPARAKPEPDKKDCGPAPAVNSATGEVSNYNHFRLNDNTCGENVEALNKLCLSTWVQDKDISYQRYEPATHTCVTNVPNPSCEQQLCDAMYCTSPTVRHVLPPQHKHTGKTGECLNPSETDVAAACNEITGYQWVTPQCLPVQVLSVIQVFPFSSTVSALTGTLVMPRYDNMLFTYQLDDAEGGSQQGSVLITAAPTGEHCAKDDSMCVGYTIHASVQASSTYTLTVFGRPTWSPTVTLQSVEPVTVDVTANPPDAHVTPALNVHPSRDAVLTQLATGDDALRTVLAPLLNALPGFKLPSNLSFGDLIVSPNTSTQLLTVACTPNLCPLEGSQSLLMPYAIVLVAWPPVPGALSYTATRQRSENVGSVVQVSRGLNTVFADLVRVNDVVTYTIVTTGADDMRSEPVSFTTTIPSFPDKEVCHKVLVPPPFNTKLPPWMWSSPSGCQWFPDLISAQNYYCLFEDDNPDHVLHPDALKLVDRNGVCQRVSPAHAYLTRDFSTPYCSSTQPGACFTGYKDPVPRAAKCPTELKLGNSGVSVSNVGAFSERLGEVVAFHNQYNTWDSAKVDAINTSTDREALYYKTYYSCGPENNATDWGVRGCAGNDQACVDAANSAHCAGVKGDDSDRNLCFDWELDSTVDGVKQYTQKRMCFVSPDARDDECCGENLKYVFDNQQPAGATRGSCV